MRERERERERDKKDIEGSAEMMMREKNLSRSK